MLELSEKDWQIVKEILQKYPYVFYAFGSRVKHTAKKFSDLDLCYKENIPLSVIVKIESAFEESDLPFKVDIVDWKKCDESFQRLIEKDFQRLVF